MRSITSAQQENLEGLARENAARNEPNHIIVANLRIYCLENAVEASYSDLSLIAELARGGSVANTSEKAERDVASIVARGLKDRRKTERRQGPRRIGGRRRTGLEALLVNFRRLGKPERRSGNDRRGVDRREVFRRRHVRRMRER